MASLHPGHSIENFDFKFLELRKYWFGADKCQGVCLLAIDNQRQCVFLGIGDQIKWTTLRQLTDFEWNKSIINQVIEPQQFAHATIKLPFLVHYLSVSANGFGSRLVVSGQEPGSNSSVLLVYDLNSLQPNSAPIARVNLTNSFGCVAEISWHSEFNDTLFACITDDGSVFVILIEANSVNICSHLSPQNGVFAMSLCWSPKGKQIVVGYSDGHFSQFKHSQGQLQEVKKTQAPAALQGAKIHAIKWIVSSLFIIGYRENTSDVHIVLVSTPSKAQPQWTDFGQICMDTYDAQTPYRINFVVSGNIILCTTSVSSEVGVIGCDSSDVAAISNWSQWILDDNSRIELPMDKQGNESFAVGIGIMRGTDKRFKINENETYGGVGHPYLLILTSSAILSPYLVIHKKNALQVPEAPPVKHAAPVSPKMGHPKHTSPAKHELATVQTPQQTLQPATKILEKPIGFGFSNNQQPKTDAQLFPPFPAKATSTPIKTPHPQKEQTLNQVTQKSESNAVRKTKSEEEVKNDTFTMAIKEEIKEFNNQMKTIKKSVLEMNVDVGPEDEMIKIRENTRLQENVLSELKMQYKNFSSEASTLQEALFESFSRLEEVKSLIDRETDPRYLYLIKKRSLDPSTGRKMQEIENLNHYINLQLRELDAKIEQEWNDWLETRQNQARMANRSPRKDMELIFKNLAFNQKSIHLLRQKLELTEDNPKINLLKEKLSDLNEKKKDIQMLTKSLKGTSICDSELDLLNQPTFRLKTISKEKQLKLKEFLESRQVVAVRRCIDVVDDNSSSFISAVEKISSKIKKKTGKTPAKEKSNTVKASETPKKVEPKTPPKSQVKPQQQITKTLHLVKEPEETPKITFNVIPTSINTPKEVAVNLSVVLPKPKPKEPTLQMIPEPSKTIIATTAASTASVGAAQPPFRPFTFVQDVQTTPKATDTISLATASIAPAMPFPTSFSFGPVPQTITTATPEVAKATPATAALPFQTAFKFVQETSQTKEEALTTTNSTPITTAAATIITTTAPAAISTAAITTADQLPFLTSFTSGKEIPTTTTEETDTTTISTTTPSIETSTTTTVTTTSSQQSTIQPSLTLSQGQETPKTTAPTGLTFGQSTSAFTPFATSSFAFGNNSNQTAKSPGQFSFGSASGPFGSPPLAVTTASGTLGFGSAQQTSGVNPNDLKICSGLGGQPTPENANKNTFSFQSSLASVASQQTPTSNLFGATQPQQQPQQQQSPQQSSPGSFSSGSRVAQTGFGSFQTTSPSLGQFGQQQPTFGSSPAFGSSPTFGSSAAFGAQPVFGGSPSFGNPQPQAAPAFGGSPTFGASLNNPQQPLFGSFASVPSNLSFGALASVTQSSSFPSQQPSNFNSDSFMQRRM